MIDIKGLSKSFGSHPAVDGISFGVNPGALFAFLGTNGAGKSTTINCVTTLLAPDAGEVTVAGFRLGKDDHRIRSAIGTVFQDSVLDPLLSVHENIALKAALYGVKKPEERIASLSEVIDLGDFLHQPYGTLSGGQKRRVDIARALVHEPQVLFLDEPTSGLDPQSRETVWSTLHDIRTRLGLTIFLTTHYMAETEQATDVTIIDQGKIVVQGTPSQLRQKYSSSILSITTTNPGVVDAACRAAGLTAIWRDKSSAEIAVPDSAVARDMLASLGDTVSDFEFRHGTMDDVFLSLTRKGASA